jgi:hypothetical protein
MPKHFVQLLAVGIWLLVISTIPQVALAAVGNPMPPSPTSMKEPACDLCGWCYKGINPSPPTWQACHACIYDATGNETQGSYYTVLGCLSTKPGGFVKSMLSVLFSIAGGIAFLSVLYGSATILTSQGDPGRLQDGKDMVTSSIIGILLIVFSVFLLRIVGYDILRIPGFG